MAVKSRRYDILLIISEEELLGNSLSIRSYERERKEKGQVIESIQYRGTTEILELSLSSSIYVLYDSAEKVQIQLLT